MSKAKKPPLAGRGLGSRLIAGACGLRRAPIAHAPVDRVAAHVKWSKEYMNPKTRIRARSIGDSMAHEKDAFEVWMPVGLAVAGIVIVSIVGYSTFAWVALVMR